MAQIAASDVTYAAVAGTSRANSCDPMPSHIFSITFGNGTLTYTNGGIPLTKAKLGCPANIHSLVMLDSGSGSGYLCKWNQTSNTIQLYNDANITAGAASAFIEVLTSAAVTATTLRVLVQGY